jgi:hypothetical protein
MTPQADMTHQTEATIEDITNEPDRYVGETVTIRGEIGQILGPRSLTLAEEGFLFGGGRILIVGADGPAPTGGPAYFDAFDADSFLRVTGQVHVFNVAAFEDHLGYDLNDALADKWGGRPAIIATSIQRATAGQNQAITIDMISDGPSDYYGCG